MCKRRVGAQTIGGFGHGLCTCGIINVSYVGIVHNDIQDVCWSSRLATALVLEV